MLHFGDIFIVNILDGIVGEQFCMSSWSTFTVNLENYAEILELMPNFLFTFKKLRSWYLHSMSFIHSREFLNLNLVAVKCLKMSRMKKMSHDERGHVNWKLKLYQFKGKDIIATTVLKFLVRFNILNISANESAEFHWSNADGKILKSLSKSGENILRNWFSKILSSWDDF